MISSKRSRVWLTKIDNNRICGRNLTGFFWDDNRSIDYLFKKCSRIFGCLRLNYGGMQIYESSDFIYIYIYTCDHLYTHMYEFINIFQLYIHILYLYTYTVHGCMYNLFGIKP